MVASHLVWLLRTRGIRQRAKENEKTFDEFPEGVAWQSQGIDIEGKIARLFKRNSRHAKKEEDEWVQEPGVETEIVDVAKNAPHNTVPNGVV